MTGQISTDKFPTYPIIQASPSFKAVSLLQLMKINTDIAIDEIQLDLEQFKKYIINTI